jgi:DNA polymerase-3 subunit epsilon
MNPLIYIDIETTGLLPSKHGIVQLAYMVEIGEEIVEEGEYLINPHTYNKPIEITDKALEVNGRTREELTTFEDSKAVYQKFTQMMNKYISIENKLVPVAYNSQFDIRFIQAWFQDLKSADYSRYLSYKDLDVFQLVKYLQTYGRIDTGRSQSLVAAYRAVFGEEFDAHDALEDIRATRRLHQYLIKEFIR